MRVRELEYGINSIAAPCALPAPALVHLEGSILPSGVLATFLVAGILSGDGARLAAARLGDTLTALGELEELDSPQGGPASGRFP